MDKWYKRAFKILKILARHQDFVACDHKQINFGRGDIHYYTGRQGDKIGEYFSLKFDGLKITFKNCGVGIISEIYFSDIDANYNPEHLTLD